ncbi:MAG: metallophosphoesterase family protein [Oscillospiraceae bacterium]|nr:metallophosphoesterase family protein [Oscillospiraceae bacterium]
MIYYTADLHLGHENVIKFSGRPFSNLEEMDKTLIANWRAVVQPNDDIYVLGDLIFKCNEPEVYLKQLTGRIHLIKGNHDTFLKNKALERYFVSIDDMLTIADEGRRVFLCHYPMAEWPGYYRDAVHLFGHIHNNRNEACEIMETLTFNYNVGVDCIGFSPLTLTQIIGFYGERKRNG